MDSTLTIKKDINQNVLYKKKYRINNKEITVEKKKNLEKKYVKELEEICVNEH